LTLSKNKIYHNHWLCTVIVEFGFWENKR